MSEPTGPELLRRMALQLFETNQPVEIGEVEIMRLEQGYRQIEAERDAARAGYDRLMEALTAQTILGTRMAGVVAVARQVGQAGTKPLLRMALNDLRSALALLDHETTP